MLAQTLVTGDKLRTLDLPELPAGTTVQSLGSSGWWEITEVPQVETVNERDQLARALTSAWFKARGVRYDSDTIPTNSWRTVADYVLANFTPAETAAAEVAADEVVDYPKRVRDSDGDPWTLVGPGRYSLVNDRFPGGVRTTNVSLADLLVNFGPISAV